jgi:diamine N-acetyltransferase
MKEILQNEHIQLRALEKKDLDYLYKWENNTELWHLSNTKIPFSKYSIDEFIKASQQDIYEAKQLRLIIQHRESEKPLGTIDLFDFDPYHLRTGIGVLIAEKNDRKKGYASEALDTLMNYCKEILSLKQVYCNILENNQDSLRLFISKGFIITGTKKDWIKQQGDWITEFTLQYLFY